VTSALNPRLVLLFRLEAENIFFNNSAGILMWADLDHLLSILAQISYLPCKSMKQEKTNGGRQAKSCSSKI
jgi:hypothetical protein